LIKITYFQPQFSSENHVNKTSFLRYGFFLIIACLWSRSQLQAQSPQLIAEKTQSFPLDIEATQGIVCDQHQKTCIASGHVIAIYGDYILTCDRLVAHFKERSVKDMPQTLWQVEAQGQVQIRSKVNDQMIQGQIGTYNLETQHAVLTGNNLKLNIDGMTVTAMKRLEFWVTECRALAYGEAKAVQGDRRLHADKLKAFFKPTDNRRQVLSRLEGQDNVMIFTATEVVQADQGVYNKEQDQAVLTENVKIVRRDGVMEGDEAIINLKTGISSLRNNKKTSQRVRVLIMPAQKK